MKNKKKLKEYETVWTCDYCEEEFETKKESDIHELVCKKNKKKGKHEGFWKGYLEWLNTSYPLFYIFKPKIYLVIIIILIIYLVNTDDKILQLFNIPILSLIYFLGIRKFAITRGISIKDVPHNIVAKIIIYVLFCINIIAFLLPFILILISGTRN